MRQVELLDQIEGWSAPPRATDHWHIRFGDYIRATQQNGYRPRDGAPHASHERSLMIWMLSQQKRLRAGTMPEDRAALLDRALPGWRGRTEGLD